MIVWSHVLGWWVLLLCVLLLWILGWIHGKIHLLELRLGWRIVLLFLRVLVELMALHLLLLQYVGIRHVSASSARGLGHFPRADGWELVDGCGQGIVCHDAM